MCVYVCVLCVLCVCMHVCVCLHMRICVQVHVHVCLFLSQRRVQASFLNDAISLTFETKCHIGMEFAYRATMADQQAPGICLSTISEFWDYNVYPHAQHFYLWMQILILSRQALNCLSMLHNHVLLKKSHSLKFIILKTKKILSHLQCLCLIV